MGTKIKTISKLLATGMLFILLSFSNESKAQCAANMTYTSPQPGEYVFTGYLTPNSAWMYYYWDFADGNTAQGSSATITHQFSFPGIYNVCVTAVDSTNGCYNYYCQYITVNSTICDITPAFTSMNMINGNVMFTDATIDNGGGTITGWFWSFGDGATSTLQNPSHTYVNNNTYGVMLTVYNSNGCTDTVYNYVVVQNAVGCNLYASSTSTSSSCSLCNGTLTAITTGGTAPFTFLWGNGATTQTITGLCSGYYDLTVSDAMGCTFDNVGTVFNSAISASITMDTSASNGTVILYGSVTGGTGPYIYSWYIPGGNPSYSSTPITTVLYPYPSNNMTVCLTVYDANNCYDSTCNYFSIGGYTNCSGFSAAVTGSQTSSSTWNLYAAANGGTAPYSYQWTINGGVSTCGYNQSIACGSYSQSGTYIACCQITDALGCVAQNCYTVVINMTNSCVANFYLYNYSDSIYIYNNSQASGTATYYWDFDDGTNSTNGTLQSYFGHHYSVAGNYNVCLYISDVANNCYDTLCQTIYACALSADVTYSLNGNIVSLQGNISGSYTSFGWYLPSGMNTTDLNIEDTLATSGLYYYTFWAVDSVAGCYDSTFIQVPANFITNNLLSGVVFNDSNGNGIQDAGEPGIGGIYVQVAGQWILTDPNGLYFIYVADGTWTLDVYVTSNWTQTFPVSPTSYTVTVAGGSNISNINFGLQSNQTTITGVVFNDSNSNGIQDAGETGVSNTWVMVGWYWAITDVNGVYTVTVPVGVYNVELWSIPAGVTLTTPLSGNYTVNASAIGQIYDGNDFGLNYPPGVQDMVVYLSTCTTVTPCFPAWYNISYYNAGTVPVNATVTMIYDPQLFFDYSSPPATTIDTVAHIITWNVGVVQPGVSGWIWVDFVTSCTVLAGDAAFNAVTIQPIAGDAVPANNIDTLHQIATSSWDPNDKQVSPSGVGPQGLIHADQRLDYTIHFQNTGNAPAMNVVLIDTLSAELDWTSINILSYSHPMVSELDTTTGIITFFYNNIFLPDSGSDYLGSMGNVKYSIMPKTGIVDGAVINNFADIYFDMNAPVRTSTTLNTIDYKLGANELNLESQVHIYPNPANESAYIVVEGLNSSEFELKMTNVLGQEVELLKGQFNQVLKLNLNDLQKGIYFIDIISNNETISVQKLIVQ